MNKIILFLCLMVIALNVKSQDSSHVKFKPGTLVSKYYGAYEVKDSAEKLPEQTTHTKKVSQLPTASQKTQLANQPLTNKAPVRINPDLSSPDALETTKTSQLSVSDGQQTNIISNQPLSVQSPVPARSNNVQTISPDNITTPAVSERYRSNRLGSSSPLYDTYEKNNYGAGSITTGIKSAGGAQLPYSETGESEQLQGQKQAPIYRPTRLGSSSPDYNTYEKNDNGAGSVTTNPNKWGSGGGGVPVVALPPTTSDESARTPANTTAENKSRPGNIKKGSN